MADDPAPSDVDPAGSDAPTLERTVGLGPGLRRAWLGYRLRLDAAMADAGFGDQRLPDGRVLRFCSDPAGSTISAIGRELGISRQGAGKVVAHLRERGYVTVVDSPTSDREKSVKVTVRGTECLRAQQRVIRAIDDQLRAELGAAGFSGLQALLNALDQGEQVRMSTYLQTSTSTTRETSDGPDADGT